MADAIPTPPSPKFGRAVFASQSPYMPAQTSVTAGTLCAMPLNYLVKVA